MANEHICKRFKTAFKRRGVRMKVACRECGEVKIIAMPHPKLAGPAGRLP